MIVTATEGRDIRIGKVGENEATVVRFDISRILAEFPGASVTILNQRPGDRDAYPVNGQYVEVHGTKVDWTVQSGDLTKKGVGMCQLVATLNSVVVKTVIYSTMIMRALGDSATPPAPWTSWVTEVTDAADRAEDAAELLENPGAVAVTLGPNDEATASYSNGTFIFGIPKGRDGGDLIDDTAGAGAKDKAWSADKLSTEFGGTAAKNNTEITGSLSMGRKSGTSVGGNSTALGSDVVATGLYAHAEGASVTSAGTTKYTTASGTAAHAEGSGTTAAGTASHAEGRRSEANASYSHAEGDGSKATGYAGHAEGVFTQAGNAAHSEGINTIAGGSYSHAEGNNTKASGDESHAEGWETEATGVAAHAEGYHTIANSDYMHAIGLFNVRGGTMPEWVSGTAYKTGDRVIVQNGVYDDCFVCITANSDIEFDPEKWDFAATRTKEAFVIGNGTSSETRSNAAAIDLLGNGMFGGDLYVKCNNDGTGGSKVASMSDLHQVPTGGTTGQVLAKNSGTNYDVAWVDQSGGDAVIDDTAGAGDTDKVWSADKVYGLEERIANLEYVPVTINSLSVSPSLVEKGSTQTSATLTYGMNRSATQMKLDDSVIQNTAATGTISLTGLSLTANKTWTLKATDERKSLSDEWASRTVTMTFTNKVKYGAAAAPNAINDSFLNSLPTRTLSTGKVRSFSVTAGTGQYIWYALPSSYGTCTFTVGGFSGGFSQVALFTHTNESGAQVEYRVYRSDNANLGAQTVTVS